MIKIFFILFLTVFTTGFSQSLIEGYVLDKTSNEPLPYATVKLIKSETYTITNEDGKFEIQVIINQDSIEVSYLGFRSNKVPISYFIKEPKLYLTPNISSLDEVIVIADKNKNYAYDLLNSVIRKYRNKNSITESKAFLSLTSSARTIPIEQIEGFFNSSQSLSNGIIDLEIKSGRFGQNKSFPFYSLDNTTVLKDFQFFNRYDQILPSFFGNMGGGAIKNKYIVKVENCKSCSDEDISISFVPLKNNGKLFSGKILLNKNELIIKKIELRINDPIIKGLSAITENDIITPREIKLKVLFNPMDYEKIQYLDFTFIIYYDFGRSGEVIKSHSFLYFYDYNNSFENPYFTNSIKFRNDYDKIIVLQASDDFWDSNYQFPKSYSENRSMDFLKEYGYLINYNNNIPLDYIEIIKPSIVIWNKEKQIEWKIIKQAVVIKKNKKDHIYQNYDNTTEVDKVYHSVSELNNKKRSIDEVLNFSYMIDAYTNKKGEEHFVTRTLFDRNSSYFEGSRTKVKLLYINLIFDIYEYYRQILEIQFTDEMTFEEAKNESDIKFKQATATIAKMKKETNRGLNYQNVMRWNSNLATKLNKN